MILEATLWFLLATLIEAMVINYRTRQNLPDLDHTWLVVYRVALFGFLAIKFGEHVYRLVALFAAFWMHFSFVHKIALPVFRKLAYPRLSYFRMGSGFWDRKFLWLFHNEALAWLAQAVMFGGLYVLIMFYIVPLTPSSP